MTEERAGRQSEGGGEEGKQGVAPSPRARRKNGARVEEEEGAGSLQARQHPLGEPSLAALSVHAAAVVTCALFPFLDLAEHFRLARAGATGEAAETANENETATVRLIPSATKTIRWQLTFTK